MGIGKDAPTVEAVFGRWLAALGEDGVIAECVRLAPESRNGVPRSLAWFVGWLETVPGEELERRRQRIREPEADA